MDASVWCTIEFGKARYDAYSNIVRLFRIRRNSNENSENAEEGVDHSPPGKVWVFSGDVGDDGGNECYQPSELLLLVGMQPAVHEALLTIAIDVVARAKGSPMMRPMLNLGPSENLEPPSILRKDGECMES